MDRTNTSELQWHPSSVEEKAMVQEQLERILANPLFSQSKRYPPMLRHIVECTLRGDAENLKERTLGVEVFHRDPNYDTNADTVVRVTAGEIRKRLAQYYFDPEHENELRLELQSGSYVPVFHNPAAGQLHPPEQPQIVAPQVDHQSLSDTAHAEPTTPAQILNAERKPKLKKGIITLHIPYYVVFLLLLGAIVAVFSIYFGDTDRRMMSQFWEPVLKSKDQALLCVGDYAGWNGLRTTGGIPGSTSPNSMEGNDSTPDVYKLLSERPLMTDVQTLTRLSSVLLQKGKAFQVKNASATDLSDLRNGPAVLIGMNNGWTIRAITPLRFNFVLDPVGNRIVDKEHPDQTKWVLPLTGPVRKFSTDYGIVARLQSTTNDQPLMIAAGLGAQGTTACGELLSNPRYMRTLIQHAPKNWQKMNMEAVISAETIEGKAGPPRVEAYYFW
jgi:hypothetical protein